MALRWCDIDLDRGAAVLHETKNGERRAIAITGTALEVMRERFETWRRDTDLVLAGPPTIDRTGSFSRRC